MLRILGDSHVIAFRDGSKTADTFQSDSLEGSFGGAQAGIPATAGILPSRFSRVPGNTMFLRVDRQYRSVMRRHLLMVGAQQC